MPIRILMIGLLFCLAGVLAIWDIVADFLDDRLSVNLAVFFLPIGIGLLQGKARSRWWARFWIIIGYLGCGFLSVAVVVVPRHASATWGGREIEGPEAVPYVILVAAFVALLLFVLHRILYSAKANAFFEQSGEQVDPHAEQAPG